MLKHAMLLSYQQKLLEILKEKLNLGEVCGVWGSCLLCSPDLALAGLEILIQFSLGVSGWLMHVIILI